MHKNQRRLFTPQENYFIQKSVEMIGENWEIIAKILPGRTPKQIHDRYINYLREGLMKNPWTKDEDNYLIQMHERIGPKWTKMVEKLPGRSANDIKNRWHKHIIKQYPELTNKTQVLATFIDGNENLIADDFTKKTNDGNDYIDIFNSIILKEDFELDGCKDAFFIDNLDSNFM